jgi:glycosyltransferase involved in cell wall biosynthesis
VTGPPTFSVVIPAYNAARTLPSTIRSVLAQTKQDFEIIVVDDGSTDDTAEALRRTSDDRRIRYLRQGNLGPASARTAGVQAADGEFVSFLDSDDLWLPIYLESMAAALDDEPAPDLAYTDAWRFIDGTRRIFRRPIMSTAHPPPRTPPPGEALLLEILRRNFVFTSATVRRATVEAVGGFTTFTRSEDYELWVKIAASGARFARADGVLALYRDRADSRVSDPAAMVRGRKEIYEHILQTYDLSPAARAIASARFDDATRELDALEEHGPPPPRQRSPVRQLLHHLRNYRLLPPRAVARSFPDLRSV